MQVIRLDWRLIHANTIDFWIRPLGLSGIVLCDNQIAIDPLKQVGLKLFCPIDFEIQFVSLDRLPQTDLCNKMLLFRNVEHLVLSGVNIRSGDLVAISPYQPLTQSEVDFLSELALLGVHTTFDSIFEEVHYPL